MAVFLLDHLINTNKHYYLKNKNSILFISGQ